MTQSPPPGLRPRLLGPRRVAFQWLTTLAVLLAPFVTIGGNSLLRVDFSSLSVHVAGTILPTEALWLLLLAGLALVLLFLLITLAFGRAWCGWACPQTTLVDLVEWCARSLGVKVGAGTLQATSGQKLALQLLYVCLALLIAANLCWYFIPPDNFFTQLATGTLHWAAWTLLGFTAAAVYLDLGMLRRLFCKEFCPYGRFQTALIDPGTLVLRFHPDEAPRCIRCGACVRACPTGIDIRDGEQIECINCGRCLDACREVMASRCQPGIIRYTFGLAGRGPRALLNARLLLVTLAFLAISGALVTAAWQRAPVTFKVARHPALLPRMVSGDKVLNFYSAYLVNHGSARQEVTFTVSAAGFPVHWRGPVEPLTLAPGEHRRVDFGLEAAARQLGSLPQVGVAVLAPDGTPLAAATVTLTGPLDKPVPVKAE